MTAVSKNEIKLLHSVLPEDKPGYRMYRKLIAEMKISGDGRFGDGNFFLGKGESTPDLSLPSTPVLAAGKTITNLGTFDVIIHELEDEMIEVQLSERVGDNADLIIIQKINFSDWKPGNSSPGNTNWVNEFILQEDKYTLVLDKWNKRIWLYDHRSCVNHLIPVSNYFNELMRLKRIKDENLFKSPAFLFDGLDDFTSEDFKLAFYQYNKYMRRFNISLNPSDLIKTKKNKKKLIKLFSRD